jgi:hypothetical protein
MGNYAHGTVTVTSTPAVLCTVGLESDGVIIANTGAATVFLGGRTVTATGATAGVPLAAGASMTVPSVGGLTHALFAVTASTSSTVAFLFPAG